MKTIASDRILELCGYAGIININYELNQELRWLSSKESACKRRKHRFNTQIRKVPWRRKQQLTPVFLPEKYHGQRSLAGCNPQDCKRVGYDLATKFGLPWWLSITMNKASGGDGIPVELFQILKDDAVKVLHSICQQIWKTQQWPQDWKRSVFIPIPKKGNAKEC